MVIGRNRGRVLDIEDAHALITVHPSYLLRLHGEDKKREYEAFVADLKVAEKFLR